MILEHVGGNEYLLDAGLVYLEGARVCFSNRSPHLCNKNDAANEESYQTMDTEMETCFEPIKAESRIIARKENVQQMIAQLNQLLPDMKKVQFESHLLHTGISENAPTFGTPVTHTEQLRNNPQDNTEI